MTSEAPERTFILTGMPRSGTTYLAALLFNPPSVITLSESGGQWKRFFREHGRSRKVLELVAEHRRQVEHGDDVMTFADTEGFRGARRVDTWNQPKVSRYVAAEQGFHLGLKNPEVFLEFLEVFTSAGLKCVITVRHPVRVINSWVKRVQGRVARGLPIDGTFADGECVGFRSSANDPVTRRIELFNYLAGRIIEHQGHENVLRVKHEDWRIEQLDRVYEFLRLVGPPARELRPPLIPPDPVELPAEECERIMSECVIAAELGYPMRNGRLTEPDGPVLATGI